MNRREIAIFLPLVLLDPVDGHLSRFLPRSHGAGVDKLSATIRRRIKLARTASLVP